MQWSPNENKRTARVLKKKREKSEVLHMKWPLKTVKEVPSRIISQKRNNIGSLRKVIYINQNDSRGPKIDP